MLDILRKYTDSLAGVTEMSRERAEKLVKDLQKRGEIRSKDLQRSAQEFMKRSSRNRKELVRLVQKEIRDQVRALGLATREDVEKLNRRLRALEGKGGSGKPRAKSSAKSGPKAKSTKTTAGP